VSSGVEERPGLKDTKMIEQFVAAARLAALEQNA
jgi:phosphoribosylanthranilate isomerase